MTQGITETEGIDVHVSTRIKQAFSLLNAKSTSPREEIKLLKGNPFLWQVFLWGKKPREMPIHLGMTGPAIVCDPSRILPPEFSPDSTVALSAWGSVSEPPLPVLRLLVMWDGEVGFVKFLGSLSGPNFIIDSWRLKTRKNEDRKPLCSWLPSCPPLFLFLYCLPWQGCFLLASFVSLPTPKAEWINE